MKIELENLAKQPESVQDIVTALGQVLTVGEYVKVVRERTGNEKISNQTIHYHLKETDNLDYVEWCGMMLIIQNEKAEKFDPGGYYGGNRQTSITSFKK